jgi:hypothetical protein
MANKHQLSLDIPYTSNPRIFRIVDASIYNANVKVDCQHLEVTPPGFNEPVNVPITTTQFSMVLTACNLGLQTKNCVDNAYILPDGIYIIKYSVSPNDKVYVEYHHLRVTQFIGRYNQLLCDLELHACEPSADVKAQLDELRLIKSFIDAAKVKVEDCHDDAEGMNLLAYAQQRLMKLSDDNC